MSRRVECDLAGKGSLWRIVLKNSPVEAAVRSLIHFIRVDLSVPATHLLRSIDLFVDLCSSA